MTLTGGWQLRLLNRLYCRLWMLMSVYSLLAGFNSRGNSKDPCDQGQGSEQVRVPNSVRRPPYCCIWLGAVTRL